MTQRDELVAVEPVADALESLGIEFYVGGSVASSAYGVSRSTADVDLVAAIGLEHVDALVARLEASYYVEATQIAQAIRSRTSFNVLHLETMYKVDVFVMKDRPFDQEARRRTRSMSLAEDSDRLFAIASPEDTILSKLEWYREGGEQSERQWMDVAGVIRVQRDTLDRAYLASWAERLGVTDLLQRALAETSDD
jgi:hypothetical protein